MNIIIKYIISGGTAAFVDLSILNFLDSLGLYYLVSVNIAFLIAFIVSFRLQKYWTFHDAEYRKTHHQLSVYFIVSVLNVFVNSFLVHLLLSWNLIPPIIPIRPVVIAQFMASAIIAIETFAIYRFLIFKKDRNYKKPGSGVSPKILIITQKVDMNDSYFGFFHGWISRFAERCEKVTVITLEKGEYQLPENTKVLTLKKGSKISSLFLLLKYSISERKNYDFVFCHMSPIFVISGWILWELMDKTIGLWYVHKKVDLKLRVAHMMSDIVFTATLESFNIPSKKIKYLGQGIDIGFFSKPQHQIKISDNILNIVTVGRVTPIKNLETLIEAIGILKSKNISVLLNIIGESVVSKDLQYKEKLQELIRKLRLEKEVNFVGAVANKDLPKYYWNNDIFVNLAPTGGLDKAVLEAMAAEIPVIVSNKAFVDHLDGFRDDLLVEEKSAHDLAQKIENIHIKGNYNEIGKALKNEVIKRSNLDILIYDIVKNIQNT